VAGRLWIVHAQRPLALTLLAAGCQSLVGIEDSPPLGADASAGGTAGSAAGGESGAAGSAGTDAGASGSSGAGAGGAPEAGCGSARWPLPPSGVGLGGDIDFVAAVREIDFGDRDQAGVPSWTELGYDLDKLCTCGTDPGSACTSKPKPVCDGLEGRDNATGILMYDLRNSFMIAALDSIAFSQNIENGTRTLLIRVSGYNGQSDDDQVRVSWYSAYKFESGQTPKWDGTDVWPVVSSALLPIATADGGEEYSLDQPKYFDDLAYVSGGVLVASLPDGEIALSDVANLRFTAAFLTARIENIGSDLWKLEDGVLAGVTRSQDMLAALPFVDLGGAPLCKDHFVYTFVKPRICGYADMFATVGTPTKPCDALSLGVGLRAHSAKLGEIKVVPTAVSPCAPGLDPSEDSCAD
jgi:hypothetical protein